MGAIIELQDVRMHFSVRKGFLGTELVRAVDGVTVSIDQGETLGLVGESGSGKTTLGKVAQRLLRPTGGRVVFDGNDITDLNEGNLKWFRRRSQEIFQDPYSSLDPTQSVSDIISEPLLVHGVGTDSERRDMVRSALEDVRLFPPEEFERKYPHMLSGGQRQRVGIARAIMLNPQFIVADEPVSMIDASSRAEILYLLKELQRKYGIAYLYITHDIATAKYFSNKIAVMYLGKIVELSTPERIIKEPLHPYTTALIASVPEPNPSNRLHERKVIPGEPPSPINIPSGCRFHPRCPYFMKGKCDAKEPELVEATPGHHVACLLY